jgi:hypothetical protein
MRKTINKITIDPTIGKLKFNDNFDGSLTAIAEFLLKTNLFKGKKHDKQDLND